MVTISRAEYEQLQQEKAQMESTRVRLEAERIKLEAEHVRLEAKLATLEQEQAQVITSLTLQNEWLLEQLKLSKKKLFGRSSEPDYERGGGLHLRHEFCRESSRHREGL